MTIREIMKSCDSVGRARVFLAWAPGAERDEFWSVLRDQVSGFDRVDHAALVGAMAQHAPAPEIDDEIDAHIVFRGQNGPVPNGVSWSTDEEVAMGFARGHRGIRHQDPHVISRYVTREEIALIIDDRGEAEVILKTIPE